MWETILICTIILVVVFYLLRLFKNIEFETTNVGKLYPFSSELRFDPFPQEIDVTNPYTCSPTDLRKCTISDQTSCIGCQSMIARCTHFSSDTKFFDDDGTEHTIPANTDPDEGYCLTVTNNDLNVDCNVFHGDIALIKISPESIASMFFCNCKNPGFIGNTSLLGACDTPFICNGKIDDINQNLEDINCKCSVTQQSVRNNDGLPMCVNMTVQEASSRNKLNDFMNNVEPSILAPIEIFNPILRNQLRVDSLVDPCKFCPLTKKIIDNSVLGTIEDEKFCSIHLAESSNRNSYFGVPYRRSPEERLLTGDFGGPDAILGVYWHEMMVYDNFLSDQRQIILFKIEHELNENFYIALDLDSSKNYWIYTDNLLLGLHIPIPRLDYTEFPGTSCWERWPNYDCSFSVRMIDGRNLPNVNFTNTALEYIAPNTNIFKFHMGRDRPSGPFLLDLDVWNQMNLLNDFFSIGEKVFGENRHRWMIVDRFTSGVYRTSRFAGDAQLMAYTFRRKSIHPASSWEFFMYSNHNPVDWNRVDARRIPRS